MASLYFSRQAFRRYLLYHLVRELLNYPVLCKKRSGGVFGQFIPLFGFDIWFIRGIADRQLKEEQVHDPAT